MTEQERINQQLQRQIDAQNSRIDNTLAKVDMLVSEMRDRDNQRAEDIREIRASIDGIGKHVQNLTVATIVGVGTSVIAVVVMVGTVVYSMITR